MEHNVTDTGQKIAIKTLKGTHIYLKISQSPLRSVQEMHLKLYVFIIDFFNPTDSVNK